MQACTICGCGGTGGIRFLIAENRWDDKLRIFHWDQRLAARVGIHHACGALHVRELVVHWMTTGSLDYPFARTNSSRSRAKRVNDQEASDIDSNSGRQIGELSLDREGMKRALGENPYSLNAILEELTAALLREMAELELEIKDASHALCAPMRPA